MMRRFFGRAWLGACIVLVGVSVAGAARADPMVDEATKRRLVLHGPDGARLVLEEMPLYKDVKDLRAVADAGKYEHILRSGSCARPGRGVAYHVSRWGPINAYDFDTYRRATFAIEGRLPGVPAPVFCVEHRGPIALKFTSSRPHTVVRAKRVASGALVARVHKLIGLEAKLTPLRGGAATRFSLSSDEGGSGGTSAHLRRGTCRVRPSSAVIDLGVIPRSNLVVALSFNAFGRGKWVIEILGDSLGGSDIKQCVEI
jgi:hypothetical protein